MYFNRTHRLYVKEGHSYCDIPHWFANLFIDSSFELCECCHVVFVVFKFSVRSDQISMRKLYCQLLLSNVASRFQRFRYLLLSAN